MATIKAFGALRFTDKAGSMEALACPPYDIISEQQKTEYLKTNERNIIRLELPEPTEEGYRTAGGTLRNWLEGGYLACDDKPALYIYAEDFTVNGKPMGIKGLVCRVKLEDFSVGIVLPHEETLSKAKDDRFNLMSATGCNFSSIYSLYFDKENAVYPNIERLSTDEPYQQFNGCDGILHKVWRVDDPAEIAKITALFSDKKLYIADGHHRYETGLRYLKHQKELGVATDDKHPANYIMMTLLHMEHPGLVVLPTHRIVRGLDNFDADKLLDGCLRYFDAEPVAAATAQNQIAAAAAKGKKAMALAQKGRCTLLTLKDFAVMAELMPEKSQAYRALDVSILHTLVLERLLGIDKENMANQKNLIYTRDVSEAVEAVNSGAANCAFIIGPTGVEEIAAIAGAGEKMPQKSTYFYPKIITGHLMNKIL